MPGSLGLYPWDIATLKMFASLINEKQCVVVLIFIYLVASGVEHFLIFLFITFISSFMNWHFVFFLILFIISSTSLSLSFFFSPLHIDRVLVQPGIFFQGHFSQYSLSSFTLDSGDWAVIFILSYITLLYYHIIIFIPSENVL